MMEKIEWYQEVLEIEPSSKVFFPLAKLLSGNNQVQKAIAVLRQGLDRHPEFFEARLMLIDLLQQERDVTGALSEVQALSAKLTAYPGFWDAWAGSVAGAGTDKDLAVALRLMAAFLRNSDISWGEIIARGLAGLTESNAGLDEASSASRKLTVIHHEPARRVSSPQAVVNAEGAKAPASTKHIEIHHEPPQPVEPPERIEAEPRVAEDPVEEAIIFTEPEEVRRESASVFTPSDLQISPAPSAVAEPDDDDGEEEHFSLRTKTMAAVLAEQGDYAGARDIYEEILAGTTDAAARADLAKRIDDLTNKLKSGHAPQAPQADEAAEAPEQGKNKLIQVLERLAGRLENRADEA